VDLSRFYIRRILRLIPALFVFLVTVACLSFTGYIEKVQPYEFLACTLYLRNIFGRTEALAHLWSLSLEEQFYTIWPPIAKLVRWEKLLWIAALTTAGMCIWRGVAIHLRLFNYPGGIYYLRPYFRFDSILIGCCLALWMIHGPSRIPKIFTIIPAPVIWLLLIVWTDIGDTACPPLYITLQMLGAVWILYRAVIGTRFTMLTNPRLRFLGKICYSLYLLQQIFRWLRERPWGILHSFPFDLLASSLAALSSYLLIEKPFLRLKKKFARKQPARSMATDCAAHAV